MELELCRNMRSLILMFLLCTPVFGFAQEVDTVYRMRLNNQDVSSTRTWQNDTLQYRYNQMKYYVTTILPYLNEAVVQFNEIDRKLNDDGLRGTARKTYLREKERYIRERFEAQIRSLNTTQGVLLIKLSARQTGLNLYDQIAAVKGGFDAMKWNGWAKFHGFNLNRRYRPEDEPDLERIMRNLGYPLPASYGLVEAE